MRRSSGNFRCRDTAEGKSMGYMESHVRKWEVGRGTGAGRGGGVGGGRMGVGGGL